MTAVLLLTEPQGAEAAQQLAASLQRDEPELRLHVLAGGPGAADRSRAFQGWAEAVWVMASEHPLAGDAWTRAAIEIYRDISPAAILAPQEALALDVMPRLAAALDGICVQDALDVSIKVSGVSAIREVYGGRLHQRVSVPAGTILVAGCRAPTGMQEANPGNPTSFQTIAPPASAIVYEGMEAPATVDVDIGEAEVIVAVGRGIGPKERLAQYQTLAELLGGVVAASRPLVDLGWMPRGVQVGQSGRTVAPKFYLACGISGAPQHILGMNRSELIIAINTDGAAPIFKVAHCGAVAELDTIVPLLIDLLRRREGSE